MTHVLILNKMTNSNKNILLWVLLFFSNQMFCQKGSNNNFNEIHADINNDKIEDIIIHSKKENHYEFRYNNGKEKKITFFEKYDSTMVDMDFEVLKTYLTFEMNYAPKYLDKNILNFTYDQLKDDWILISINSESFNSMDPDLIKTKCSFELKKKIFLSKNKVDDIIQEIGFHVMSLPNNANFKKIKCKCEKTETELDINIIRDRINRIPILEEPKKLRIDLYLEENPLYNGNLKAYNDIAYKLNSNNSSNEAIYILKKIIEKFPNSLESNLNIADSFWNVNKISEAKFYYKKYLSLNKIKRSKIPKRVIVRLNHN